MLSNRGSRAICSAARRSRPILLRKIRTPVGLAVYLGGRGWRSFRRPATRRRACPHTWRKLGSTDGSKHAFEFTHQLGFRRGAGVTVLSDTAGPSFASSAVLGGAVPMCGGRVVNRTATRRRRGRGFRAGPGGARKTPPWVAMVALVSSSGAFK
jgi:hypothetical protein